MTKRDYRNMILFVVASMIIGALLVWALIEITPYLLILIAAPAWLLAALADGAKV